MYEDAKWTHVVNLLQLTCIFLSSSCLKLDIAQQYEFPIFYFQSPRSPVVSGPLWTGPLHQASYLTDMLNLAEEWGWIGEDVGLDLEKLLKQMIEESNPDLPFGYTKLDEVTKSLLFFILAEYEFLVIWGHSFELTSAF